MAKSNDSLVMPEGLPPAMEEAQHTGAEELLSVKQQLQEKVFQLQSADERDIPKLTRELQKLRVSMLVLREVVNDIADPTTYRELTLLNKMLTGRDIEDEAKARALNETEDEAQRRLAELGVEPDRAHSMVRVLRALGDAMNAHAFKPTDTIQ